MSGPSSTSPLLGGVDPDAAAIALMAEGQSAGLSQLMDRHLTRIKSLAWHMLGDDMRAEDVAQEVMLKSWIQARSWTPGKAKFSTWMHRVATNICLDHLRKKREVLSDALPEVADSRPSAETEMAAEQSSNAVKAALMSLPDRQRAALTLCHYQNLTQSDAADILEISVSAYESLLARARRALAKDLQPQKKSLMEGFGG